MWYLTIILTHSLDFMSGKGVATIGRFYVPRVFKWLCYVSLEFKFKWQIGYYAWCHNENVTQKLLLFQLLLLVSFYRNWFSLK